MSTADTTTQEGAQAPSIFTEPVVNMGKARRLLRAPRPPRAVSSHLIMLALVRVLAEHKPRLALAVEAELGEMVRIRAENNVGDLEGDRDTLEWVRDMCALAGAYTRAR